MSHRGEQGRNGQRLKISLGSVRIVIDNGGHAATTEESDTGMRPPGWLLFTPTELRVLKLLANGCAMSREEIARKLTEESAEGRLKTTLAALVARRCLLVAAQGYRLNSPPDDLANVQAWLGTIPDGESGGEQTGTN